MPTDLSETPLTPAEKAKYSAEASQGKTPSLEIVKRFILTIRKSFLASPVKVEKSKVSRNKAPTISEDQMDFF